MDSEFIGCSNLAYCVHWVLLYWQRWLCVLHHNKFSMIYERLISSQDVPHTFDRVGWLFLHRLFILQMALWIHRRWCRLITFDLAWLQGVVPGYCSTIHFPMSIEWRCRTLGISNTGNRDSTSDFAADLWTDTQPMFSYWRESHVDAVRAVFLLH